MATTRKRVALPDISFPGDEKLSRLSQYIKILEKEVQKLQHILDQGTASQVLTKMSARTYDATWQDATGGGGGDADGENLGAGEGEIFKIALTGTLSFRTLREGDNITITQDGEEVTIAATSSISVAWDDITGKPATFPPSAHTQAATTVTFNNSGTGLVATNVQAAIAELAASPPGAYTDEDAQDAVGTILTSTTTITLSYSDGTPSITADVNEAAFSIDWSQLDSIPALLTDFLSIGDPNADRIMFWDDSAGSLEWLTVGTGLSITGTTLSSTASSPLTTKGDLFTYDTGSQRLAVGADGLVLMADAAQATGLKYADPRGTHKTLSAEILADTPTGFWKCDDASGGFADSSGGGFNLTTLQGTVTFRDNALIPTLPAATFATIASASGYRLTSALGVTNPLTGDYSIAATFMVPVIASGGSVISSAATGETEATNFQWELNWGTTGELSVFWENGAGTNISTVSGVNIVEGRVNHVAVVKDGTANTVTFYLNGVKVGTISYATEPSGGTTTPTVCLGTDINNGATDRFTVGYVSFHNAIKLTGARVVAHARAAGLFGC